MFVLTVLKFSKKKVAAFWNIFILMVNLMIYNDIIYIYFTVLAIYLIYVFFLLTLFTFLNSY